MHSNERPPLLQVSDVDGEGKSGTFPYLKGLANGDIATSKIKQVGGSWWGWVGTFPAG